MPLWSASALALSVLATSLFVIDGCHHDWDRYTPTGSSSAATGAGGLGSGGSGGATTASSAGSGGGNLDSGEDATEEDAGPDGPILSYKEEVLADAPVLYLRFGESAGPTAKDEIGNFDGTYPMSAITYGAPGAIAGDTNTAITLNAGTSPGAIQGVGMPPGLDFAGSVPFSVEVWASETAYDGYGFTVDHEDWTQQRDGWLMNFFARGVSFERWDNNTTAGSVVQSANPLPFDGYHHVVGVFDGNQLRLYIDGLLASANAATISIKGTGTAWTIGKQNCSCSTNAFAGSLDELAIYDKALSEERVLAHYHVGIGK